MTRFATPANSADRPFAGWFQRRADAVVAARSRAEMLRQSRQGAADLTPETLRDLGMSREDLTGTGPWRPDLPFFMQPGFGAGRNG